MSLWAIAPFPIPAHRTGRAELRHPALRLVSPQGTRRRNQPSPCDTAFSEGSGSFQVFRGSSPITLTSPSSKARQKSGSFPPPALPGFIGRMTLSDSRDTLRPLPSPPTGLPRLPEPLFRRAVLTTPADRAGACVDCFPARAAFPKWPEGRHPHCHFRGLLELHSRYGPSDRSAAQRRPLSRGSSPSGYPVKPLVSYQINRQLSGWILPPQVVRAFGAHGQEQTS